MPANAHKYRRILAGHHRGKRNPVPGTVTEFVMVNPTETRKVIGVSTVGVPVARTSSPAGKAKHTSAEAKPVSSPAKKTPTARITSEDPKPTEDPKSPKSTDAPNTTRNTSARVDAMTTFASSTKTSAPSSSATAIAAEISEAGSGGLSSGATAGLAGAGAAILIVLVAILLFMFRKKAQRKKQEAYNNLEGEKNAEPRDAPAAAAAVLGGYKFDDNPSSPITSERAPRVSLRPVTQFMPNLNGPNPAAVLAGTTGTGALGVAAATRAIPAHQQTHLARTMSRKEPPPALVFSGSNNSSNAQGAGAGARGSIHLLAPAGSSPTPSNFTDASITASPFVGGPPAPGAAPLVYRVQMDFTPSMGDELELRAGQLVRVIHEYDDGWALCIRLDRSQQGVCPRTCLSQRPVKPRINGPPGTPMTPIFRASPRPGLTPIIINGRPQSTQGFPSPGRPTSTLQAFTAPTSPMAYTAPSSPIGGRQSPQLQSPVIRSQSPVIRSQSPRSAAVGYVKVQYRPAVSSGNRPQSVVVPATPTTPTIMVSQSFDNEPASPSQEPTRSQGQTSAPRPLITPVRPSPLSNQTSSIEDVEDRFEQGYVQEQVQEQAHQLPQIIIQEQPYLDMPDFQEAQIHEPQQVQVHEPLQAQVHKPQQVQIHEPQQVQIHEPQQVQIHEPQQVQIHEPQQVQIHEPQQVQIHEPQQVQIHEPQQAQIFEPHQVQIHEPQQAKIFEPEHVQLHEPQQVEAYEPQQIKMHMPQNGQIHVPQQVQIIESQKLPGPSHRLSHPPVFHAM